LRSTATCDGTPESAPKNQNAIAKMTLDFRQKLLTFGRTFDFRQKTFDVGLKLPAFGKTFRLSAKTFGFQQNFRLLFVPLSADDFRLSAFGFRRCLLAFSNVFQLSANDFRLSAIAKSVAESHFSCSEMTLASCWWECFRGCYRKLQLA